MIPTSPGMRAIARNVVVAISAMAIAGCKSECIAGTGCGGPVTYAIALQTAPSNLGAIMLSIETADQTTVSIVSGRSLPVQLSGTGTRRAIILGAVTGATIATVHFSSIPAQGPTVVVLGAAANQAGGYVPVQPAAVQLLVSEQD